MLGVETPRHLKLLVGTNFHTVRPPGKTRLSVKCLAGCTLLKASVDLPDTQAGKLHDQQGSEDDGQPSWQRLLFCRYVHVILRRRMNERLL